MNEIAMASENNLLSPVTRLESMMKELIQIETESVKKIENIDSRTANVEKRMDAWENNAEVTTQQKNQIRRAVSRRVYELLELPPKKHHWTLGHKVVSEKYSRLFHSRCYAEVSKLGHLASPYETTAQKNYNDSIKDIEAWIPANGVTGLKKEADDNATARKIAREQGY